MTRSAERSATEIRGLRTLVESLSHAQTVEQVYAVGLSAIYEIFNPDRAFVALAESELARPEEPGALHAGWLSDVIVPIYSGPKIVGKFMLQYDHARTFTEAEIMLAELIAMQSGLFIHGIQKQDELTRIADAAREAQRLKDELVAMAAHELRSPLTAIVGGTFLLHAGQGDPERAFEMIERNARLQEKLIEDFLNLSQIDAGKVELRMSTLDLVSVIEKVVEELKPAATAGSTSVQAGLNGPLLVRGDEQRLWQIFSNLLSNSIRFASPNGEVRLASARTNGVIEVSICDNGRGISAEHLPYIFERFRQAHPPRIQSYDGLGLGLAIVKHLVTMHGGSVRADSPGPGKGANFIVCLPAV